jgi:hypothetical protein
MSQQPAEAMSPADQALVARLNTAIHERAAADVDAVLGHAIAEANRALARALNPIAKGIKPTIDQQLDLIAAKAIREHAVRIRTEQLVQHALESVSASLVTNTAARRLHAVDVEAEPARAAAGG